MFMFSHRHTCDLDMSCLIILLLRHLIIYVQGHSIEQWCYRFTTSAQIHNWYSTLLAMQCIATKRIIHFVYQCLVFACVSMFVSSCSL